jgi:hypothetical protein
MKAESAGATAELYIISFQIQAGCGFADIKKFYI